MRTKIASALSITVFAVFLSLSSPAGSQTKKPATLAELAAIRALTVNSFCWPEPESKVKSFGTHRWPARRSKNR